MSEFDDILIQLDKKRFKRTTDHETVAPHFIVGGKIRGGVFCNPPELSGWGPNKDPEFTMDYRAMYNSIIENYFGVQYSFKDIGARNQALYLRNRPTIAVSILESLYKEDTLS